MSLKTLNRPVTIQVAHQSDAGAITRMSLANVQETELREPDPSVTRMGVQYIIDSPCDQCLVAIDPVYGCVGTIINAGYEWCETTNERYGLIETLYVLPSHRGRGVGSQLVAEALSDAHSNGFKGVRLFCRFSNLKAMLWYLRQGFRLLPYFVFEKTS